MESRGNQPFDADMRRPPISRRSCDYCRTRKIGCDRASPCSNCVSARLSCSYSKIASAKTTPKQRILLSSAYEQKIDDIATGLEEVKRLLREPRGVSSVIDSAPISPPSLDHWAVLPHGSQQSPRDQSTFITTFVNCVIQFPGVEDLSTDSSAAVSSLKSFVQSLESPSDTLSSQPAERDVFHVESGQRDLPPMNAAVSALRRAKDHEDDPRIAWISDILPLSMLTEICKGVYFAVDEYSEVQFLLTNSYLSYIFAAHGGKTGSNEYGKYCSLCRNNVLKSLQRLPLLMPTSIEAVAALVFGILGAIESSSLDMAWTLISNASDLCHRMMGNRSSRSKEASELSHAASGQLFSTVSLLHKTLALRLGRLPSIHDATGLFTRDYCSQSLGSLLRLQADVFSVVEGAPRSAVSSDERLNIASGFLKDLLQLAKEPQGSCLANSTMPSKPLEEFLTDPKTSDLRPGPLHMIYLQGELVCRASILSSVMSYMSAAFVSNSADALPAEFLVEARSILETYQRCMGSLSTWTQDPLLTSRYLDWCDWRTPFASFSMIFTKATSTFDLVALGSLETFEASIKPLEGATGSNEHPHRLYHHLAQAARTYIHAGLGFPESTDALMGEFEGVLEDFDFSSMGFDIDPRFDPKGALGSSN